MLPGIRQLLVVVSILLAAMSMGGFRAYPTQLLEQLKSNASSIVLDMETSSWIGAMHGLAGIPVIFLPMLMQWKGRKLAYRISCATVFMGWIVPLFANNAALLLTSEVFQGLATNSLMPISCLIITEMLSAKYRFLSMQLFGLSMAVGITIIGISGRFIHYKYFSVIMLFPIVTSVVLSLSWPESPPWLAYKGKLDKCKTAFTCLRGSDKAALSELNQLIEGQKENSSILKLKKTHNVTIRSLSDQITSRDFYLPSLHMFLIMNLMYWSGGDVVFVYFLELVEKSTRNEDAVFYAGIILYTIDLAGCVITSFTIRWFNNKTVLLSSTLGVILFLICFTTVLYLQWIGVLAKDSLACMYCLIGFISSHCLGLNALVFYIAAELMPVKHRSLGGSLYVIINSILCTTSLKFAPYLIKHIHMWGTFLIFTVNAVISAFLVWKYIPETKGRTLQELEDFYVYGRFIQRTVVEDESHPHQNMEDDSS